MTGTSALLAGRRILSLSLILLGFAIMAQAILTMI